MLADAILIHFGDDMKDLNILHKNHLARLAQLVETLPRHGRGHWFEPNTAHHLHQFLRFFNTLHFLALTQSEPN